MRLKAHLKKLKIAFHLKITKNSFKTSAKRQDRYKNNMEEMLKAERPFHMPTAQVVHNWRKALCHLLYTSNRRCLLPAWAQLGLL